MRKNDARFSDRNHFTSRNKKKTKKVEAEFLRRRSGTKPDKILSQSVNATIENFKIVTFFLLWELRSKIRTENITFYGNNSLSRYWFQVRNPNQCRAQPSSCRNLKFPTAKGPRQVLSCCWKITFESKNLFG